MQRFWITIGGVLFILVALVACGGGATEAPVEMVEEVDQEAAPPATTAAPLPTETVVEETTAEMGEFALSSPSYGEGEPIPALFSCDGEDISPEIQWDQVPPGTQSLTLVFDDPDAPGGTWVHWVVYNVSPEMAGFQEGASASGDLGEGSLQGLNSWGRVDYGGPCPPSGTHRYFLKLYALDTVLELGVGASVEEVMGALEGHVLAETELMGVYSR